jgi:mannosyltransferase
MLALAIVLAALRFVRLGDWSLWYDEALALSDALGGERTLNPLGYLCYRLAFSGLEVRPSEFLLRLPSAIFGFATVPLVYAAFRPLVPARQAAAAALLVAASQWHVYWSQNARFYTLELDLAVLGGALALGGLVQQRTRRVALGLLVLAAAAAAHPSAAFLLLGVVVGPWLCLAVGLAPRPSHPGPWRLLLFAGLALLAVGAPWASEVWGTWVEKKAASPAHFVATTGFYVTPFLGAGALLGAWVVLRRRAPFESLAFFTLVVSLSAATAASVFARMSAQYVFWALPWIALLCAAPLGAESRRGFMQVPRAFGTGYLALLLLPALAGLGLYYTVAYGDRPRWREAYAYVLRESEPGDLILGMDAPVGEYYLDPDPERVDLRRWREVAYLDRFRASLATQWSRYPRRTWLILNQEQLADWGSFERESFLGTLRQEFRWQETFAIDASARDLDVLVYLRD